MDILRQIYLGGVVGAGGAGFPTHKKIVKGAELLIVNAVECEPLLCSDRYVMRNHTKGIIDALISLKKEMDIQRVVIGTKAKYKREIASLKAEIETRNADIEIFEANSFYPAGDEQILIYEITGKTVHPGGIPLSLGIVVINITTALEIHGAMESRPVTHKYVTITGEVANPCILYVPIGTSVQNCIMAAGGATCDDHMVIMGGPMMGKYYFGPQLENLHISKTDGGIIILPSDHCLPTFKTKKMEHILNHAKSVCIQCSYCTEQCPRYLIGHPLHPNRIMRAVATGTGSKALMEAMLCSECGVCELHACPMHLSPRQVNIYVKNLLQENGARPDFGVDPAQTSMREYRRIDQSRLISELDLLDYPTDLEHMAEFEPDELRISLKQSSGKSSIAAVAAGDHVARGSVLGTIDFEDIGGMVHSPIAGSVISVDDATVVVRKEGGKE
jgi:Na+-translocating ferredoxin:NAD+ oxidoreductase RnfC subunit